MMQPRAARNSDLRAPFANGTRPIILFSAIVGLSSRHKKKRNARYRKNGKVRVQTMMMSKSKPKPRNSDELEGSLLPPPLPVGFAVPIDLMAPTELLPPSEVPLAAAVPIHHFEYANASTIESAMNAETKPQEQMIKGEVVETIQGQAFPMMDENIQTAPFVPRFKDTSSAPEDIARAEAERIRLAQAIGEMAVEDERVDAERANRNAFAAGYYESQAVSDANEVAKRRDQEGLFISEDKYHKTSGQKYVPSVDSDATTYKKKEGGGYEVEEYDVSDYDGKEYPSDYEYKSIYD